MPAVRHAERLFGGHLGLRDRYAEAPTVVVGNGEHHPDSVSRVTWAIFLRPYVLSEIPDFGYPLSDPDHRPTTPTAVGDIARVLLHQVHQLATAPDGGQAHCDLRLPNLCWDGKHPKSLKMIDFDRV
ncbi:hypothetical protein PAPYR_8405 [Paratrimastix pyriformis]|uniref:Protein kinase domain-containing protein n=1 Tax=Paratrimastix pyriformis TaxID=342808 RepID=A0ABQ8UD41_9EUKA|nr:hypothetical protein PAPYR_8405 [Paratrimastix pyriformis]